MITAMLKNGYNSIKRWFLTALLIMLFLCPLLPRPVSAYDIEKIISYHSDIKIQTDSSMAVTETIKVLVLGSQIKHGIYRDFPTRYRDSYGNKYVVDFKVTGVLRNGRPDDYHLQAMSNGQRIYIGRADFLLAPGEYTYTLTYNTNRQLGFFKDFDELYWNVTGNGWAFPMEEVSATVQLPSEVPAKDLTFDGYTGPKGSQEKAFKASFDTAGNTVFTATQALAPKEGLTIVLQWPKGHVHEPTATMKFSYFLRDNRGVMVGLAGLLILLAYYLSVWAQFGKDPAKGTIIPLYEPPEKLSPAAMRYLAKMAYDNKDFTVSIINMAVKGYLVISETDGDYALKKTDNKEAEALLTAEESAAARKLFGGFQDIALKNINHERIQQAIGETKKSLENNFEKTYFLANTRYFIPGLILSLIIMIASAMVESANRLPLAIFMSFWLTIWTFGVTALLHQVVSLWKTALSGGVKKIGTFGQAIFLSLFALPFVGGELFGLFALVQATSAAVVGILAVIVFVNILFYHLLKAPTLLGRKMMDKIEGFKMYLSVAEKNRLNMLNPPEKTPELFEKYLPYALALDVEQAWAEQFAAVLERASAETGRSYHPGWYSGTAWGTLGAVGLASSMSGSFAGAVSSSSTAPGSSSGGGGGGSSGGGGGGGGGGGW